MNFIVDLKEIAESFLDSFSVKYDRSLSAERIIKIYLNVQIRLIKPQPRKVLRSTKLCNSVLDNYTKRVLDEIERKSNNGEDLNPHLSKKLRKGNFTDFIFADWKIYHFHLNIELEDDYFVERADYLLFVWINDDYIYFIDVVFHEEVHVFEKTELLQILNGNWPYLTATHRSKGKVEKIPTQDEIKELREAGVIVPIQLNQNEHILPLGGGLTTAQKPKNTSVNVKQAYDALLENILYIQKYIENNIGDIDEQFSKHPAYEKNKKSFKLVLINGRLHLLEVNSNAALDLNLPNKLYSLIPFVSFVKSGS